MSNCGLDLTGDLPNLYFSWMPYTNKGGGLPVFCAGGCFSCPEVVKVAKRFSSWTGSGGGIERSFAVLRGTLNSMAQTSSGFCFCWELGNAAGGGTGVAVGLAGGGKPGNAR